MNMLRKQLILLSSVLAIFPLASCTHNSHVDYVHNGSVKLKMDYKNRTFTTDGVEQVTLKTAIDGDTAHFTSKEGTIKIRFFGIDTPESTGKVQPYGQAASNFTKEKLNNANENGTIVIASPVTTYTAPSFDSTGTRYLGIVWINETEKNASYEDLYCLNLWIVQEGYSVYKSSTDDTTGYGDTFYAAEQQARSLKLNTFSGEDDPLFNYGDYQDVSLLDLKNEIVANLKDSDHPNAYDGANVRVQGTVVGYTDRILYLANHFDEEHGATTSEGEYAGINIFTGMTGIPSRFTTVGAYIEVSAVAKDSENFGFQLSGAYFPRVSNTTVENASKVIIKAEDNDEYPVHIFQYSVNELSTIVDNKDYGPLYSPVELTDEVLVKRGYTSDDGDITLYITDLEGNDLDFNIYIPFTYAPDPDNPSYTLSTADAFVGKTVSVTGTYSYHKTTSGNINMQLIPRGSNDLTLID